MESKNAVTYLRLSTEEERDDVRLGMESQRRACSDYARQTGLNIVKSFSEIISGATKPDQRIAFPNAVKYAQQNNAVILVSRQDRFTRSSLHWLQYEAGEIWKKQPRVICTDSPNAGSLERALRTAFAEEERRLISERTKQALAVLKDKGVELGKAGRLAHLKKAREHNAEAIEVARILRDKGMTYEMIAGRLNRLGYLTSRGTPWVKQTIRNQLVRTEKDSV